MWYSDDEKNKLYLATISRMRNFLRRIGFIGDFEINCIVSENHVFPLEATTRFGYPALQLQAQFHKSPWGEFLLALSQGKDYDLKWRKGEGIVMLLAVPPFPYHARNERQCSEGVKIMIDKDILKNKRRNIHFEEVLIDKDNDICVSNDHGYVLHVSSVQDTLDQARKEVLDIINGIVIPKMFYRNDIGTKFLEEERPKLEKWGYL
jgi:phosphoribosylamine--glycine ligase